VLERINPALRILCLVLAGLAMIQIGHLFARQRAGADTSTDSLLVTTSEVAEPAATGTTNPPASSSAVRGSASPGSSQPLPAPVQAQIDRITQSEVLGPVMRPQPMALLGLAGPDAIIRTPDGRTGLLRVGEEFGGIKLLQIGTNRVVIEQDRQRKELMLFSGFGSESLLPREKDRK